MVLLHLSEVTMKRYFLFLFIPLILFCSCANQSEKIELNEKNENKDLTLMVYMAADNDLERYALENLKSMERAEFENINVLVLLDRAEGYDETDGDWTDTRLFEVCHDKSDSSLISSKRLDCPGLGLKADVETELDMSNSSVLKTFIEFGKTKYQA